MIRGDSTEYDLLKKWCETLPFYEEPKSVTTCEVGVREGLGSQVIMMGVKSRIGNIPYEHIGIDPYSDLEYQHFDDEVLDPKWKNDKGQWTKTPPSYPNSMRDQMVKDFAKNEYFKFYNMTDVDYMKIFNLTKTIFDLVLLDGPHTTKDILREIIWFGERSRKGTRIILDDHPSCNYSVIRAAISYWDFKELEKGKNKVCFQKI